LPLGIAWQQPEAEHSPASTWSDIATTPISPLREEGSTGSIHERLEQQQKKICRFQSSVEKGYVLPTAINDGHFDSK